MQFNTETGLGRVWLNLIRAGKYTLEQVPEIGNLRAVVSAALATENVEGES